MQRGHKLPLSTVHHLAYEVEPRIRLGQGEVFYFTLEHGGDEVRDVRITGDFLDWSKEGIPLGSSTEQYFSEATSLKWTGVKWSLAVELDPGKASYQNNLGYALELHGDLEAAWNAYDRALDLEPEAPGFVRNLERVEGALRRRHGG